MSVNTWERDLSKIMFLWQSHLLNQYISYTFAHMPAKYKNSYDAYVINKGFESFEKLYEANRIIVNENTPDADFKERKKLLRKGIGLPGTTNFCNVNNNGNANTNNATNTNGISPFGCIGQYWRRVT